MSNRSLYHITGDLADIANELEEGELTEALEQKLAITRDEMAVKMYNIHALIDADNADIEHAKREIKRLQDFIKSRESRIVKVQTIAMQSLLLLGKQDSKGVYRLDAGTVRLSTRKSESVEITSLEELPKEYFRTKLDVQPDKTAIKAAIVSGQTVPGAKLVSKLNLEIK